jgi:hypothetical protein
VSVFDDRLEKLEADFERLGVVHGQMEDRLRAEAAIKRGVATVEDMELVIPGMLVCAPRRIIWGARGETDGVRVRAAVAALTLGLRCREGEDLQRRRGRRETKARNDGELFPGPEELGRDQP